MFFNKPQKIVIVIDDIENMNYGDKNGMIALIKLIREKKTKKQKLENVTKSPIICVNNKSNDKKILELMNVCLAVELNVPTNHDLYNLILTAAPGIFKYTDEANEIIRRNIMSFMDNNLTSLNKIYFYYKNDFIYEKFYNFKSSIYNESENMKQITSNLLKQPYNFNDIGKILESDRTTAGLMIHENMTQIFQPDEYKIYMLLLDNFIFSDNIDRIIFQKQIWQLTEINYIIKIFYNNYLLQKYNLFKYINPDKIVFTKILTKYSREYNNFTFLYNLQQIFLIDKKDIYNHFNILQQENEFEIEILEYYDITKLELQRIYRLINSIINIDVAYISNEVDT